MAALQGARRAAGAPQCTVHGRGSMQVQVNNRESRVLDVLRKEMSSGGMRAVMRHLVVPLVVKTAH